MTDFYVPVIKAEKPYLYKIEVARQTGGLGCLSVCGRAKGQGNEGIDNLIGKITACIASPLKASVDLINADSGDYLPAREISSSTQSITLGLMTAIEFVHESRILSSPWDAIVITGDYDAAHSLLLEVGDIAEKVEAMRKLSAKNPAGKILFVYVAEEALADIPNALFFPKSTKIADFWAELFKPEFDGTQQRFLNRAFMFDKSAAFICNEQFKLARKEARSENWKGYFIYGDGESGKTTFAYRLCSYLMSVREYYAPLWISIDPSGSVGSLIRQDNSKYNGLTRAVCDQLIPFWKEADGLAQVHALLCSKKYLLVIDNLELQVCGLLEGILKETFSALRIQIPVIITSRYGDAASSLEKTFSIKKIKAGSFSAGQCLEIMRCSNPDFSLIDREKQELLVKSLTENYADIPGVMAFCAKASAADTVDGVIRSLEKQDVNFQDHMKGIVRESFLQLPDQTKGFLYCFVWKYYEKSKSSPSSANDWVLRPRDFENEFSFDATEANLQTLRSLNFIYEADRGCYGMKSAFYRILIVHDFGYSGKGKLIDIKMQLYTAISAYPRKGLVERLLHRLRDSGEGTVAYIEKLLSDAVLFNSGTDMLELLLDEMEHYGGKRSDAASFDLLKDSMNWGDDSSMLEMLIRNGGNPCATDSDGNILLQRIFRHIPEFEAKCDLLLKQGFDINGKNPLGATALHHITEYGYADQMAHLIKRGADVNAFSGLGLTPLHIAVQKEDEEKVRLLLDSGADINARGINGYAPIHCALHNCQVFNCLLEHGADIQAKTDDGESLLDLLEMGPYIGSSTGNSIYTGENLVCAGAKFMEKFKNEFEIHELLMNAKIKRCFHPKGFEENWFYERCDARDSIYSQDELLIDAMTKPLDLLKDAFYIEDNLLKRDACGNSLLHYSVLNPDITVTGYLLEKGLGVNIKNNAGATPLLWAARHAIDDDILKFLLEHGADIAARDNNGSSVLHCAALNPCMAVADFLTDSGCDGNIRDAQGFLPIGIAAAFNPSPVVYSYAFEMKSTTEEREKSFFNGTEYIPSAMLLWTENKFYSAAASICMEIGQKNCGYDPPPVSYMDILDDYKDEQLRSIMAEMQNDESKKKESLSTALAFYSCNDNPKLPVLFARAGGDLALTNDAGESVLDWLKRQKDWKYIQKQLQKHKLIDKDDRIIG